MCGINNEIGLVFSNNSKTFLGLDKSKRQIFIFNSYLHQQNQNPYFLKFLLLDLKNHLRLLLILYLFPWSCYCVSVKRILNRLTTDCPYHRISNLNHLNLYIFIDNLFLICDRKTFELTVFEYPIKLTYL